MEVKRGDVDAQIVVHQWHVVIVICMQIWEQSTVRLQQEATNLSLLSFCINSTSGYLLL